MNINLTKKNALVCGSTQGIGKATAMALAELGANITLVARNEEKLLNVLTELPNTYQNHNYIVADFQNPVELGEKVATHLKNVGIYHILVNNTGGPKGGPIFAAELEDFESAFTQHLKSNHILVQTVVPGMKEADFGRIINIISTSVKQPLDGLGVSNTIRGAVASWSKTLANELGAFGITVNNVLPGATSTERLSEIIKNKAAATGKSVEEISKMMKNSIPAKRFAQPGEIANAVAFLASEAAAYINGVNLPVDGGRTKSL
ncbi:MAG TPA: SDR family oxidoreductase [Flavobacteriia bacterium]|jgi:3-oxoacyl-[acyl-carrier protein] reductase|nr:SDR family oxidoreductase [Flavobacteriia bacterium]